MTPMRLPLRRVLVPRAPAPPRPAVLRPTGQVLWASRVTAQRDSFRGLHRGRLRTLSAQDIAVLHMLSHLNH